MVRIEPCRKVCWPGWTYHFCAAELLVNKVRTISLLASCFSNWSIILRSKITGSFLQTCWIHERFQFWKYSRPDFWSSPTNLLEFTLFLLIGGALTCLSGFHIAHSGQFHFSTDFSPVLPHSHMRAWKWVVCSFSIFVLASLFQFSRTSLRASQIDFFSFFRADSALWCCSIFRFCEKISRIGSRF